MNTKREQILKLVGEYYLEEFKEKETEFKEGDRIGYGGRYFDQDELENLVNASLDFWLTTGRYASEFEREFAQFLGVKYCSLTNSGSSANLLAFMTLTSPKLKERQIKRGDEVITVAAGFPTTMLICSPRHKPSASRSQPRAAGAAGMLTITPVLRTIPSRYAFKIPRLIASVNP